MNGTAIYGIYLRRCDECKKGMNQGYLADTEYYCSDTCLHKHYTAEEWADMFDDGESDTCYWTEWDCYDGEDEAYLYDGTKLTIQAEEA